MTTKNAEKVLEVFAAAVECPTDRRQALLELWCGSDDELRAEVESLLAHDDADAPDDFMQRPQPAVTSIGEPPTDLTDPRVGQRIGHYLIKSVIASGGMGTVYLAEQDQPRRDVALKIIRPEFASRAGLRRFEIEAEFLAQLRHSNIAHVYEAGLHQELGPAGAVRVPFFAMEYIEGAQPITEYARRQGLDVRERLQLFTQVCDAVHHGHQRGVIHRDLKPANILVDRAGEVKVIDFGVARATDGQIAVTTVGSGMSAMIGTPQYMSPEQCQGEAADVDIRSDVYSLGVVLYELLCGRKPYDFGTMYQAVKVICETEPVSPSSVDRTLRGDIEAIILAALAKDRTRRYQSVADLAADISRFLNREPISVRPPTRWTRAVRWAARHPVMTTAGLASFVALAIVGGTIATVWIARNRPQALVVSWISGPSSRVARDVRVVSLAGHVMQTWSASDPERLAVVNMEFVNRPDELGGGRLAVLGFTRHENPILSRALVAFDVDASLDTPAWARRVEPDEPVPESRTPGIERVNVPEDFVCHYGWIFDVFEESPGPEIVASFGHTGFSQSILRIYDLRGKVLYEVWHDGNINGAHWMADEGLLVLGGLSGVWTRRELGLCESEDASDECMDLHPSVVFAIRPRMGQILHDRYIGYSPGPQVWDPTWYMTIDQPYDEILVTTPWRGDGTRSVGLNVVVKKPLAQFSMILGPDGIEVQGPRQRGNNYLANQDELPDVTDFKLVPFAEVVAEKLDQESATMDGP